MSAYTGGASEPHGWSREPPATRAAPTFSRHERAANITAGRSAISDGAHAERTGADRRSLRASTICLRMCGQGAAGQGRDGAGRPRQRIPPARPPGQPLASRVASSRSAALTIVYPPSGRTVPASPTTPRSPRTALPLSTRASPSFPNQGLMRTYLLVHRHPRDYAGSPGAAAAWEAPKDIRIRASLTEMSRVR